MHSCNATEMFSTLEVMRSFNMRGYLLILCNLYLLLIVTTLLDQSVQAGAQDAPDPALWRVCRAWICSLLASLFGFRMMFDFLVFVHLREAISIPADIPVVDIFELSTMFAFNPTLTAYN